MSYAVKNELATAAPISSKKFGENGRNGVSCFICGTTESSAFEPLSENILSIFNKAGIINCTVNPAKLMCSSCGASAALMEQACRAQMLLSEKFHARNGFGKNGVKVNSVTAQLIKPGNDVNISSNVCKIQMKSTSKNIEDGFVISDVQGGLKLHDALEDGTNTTVCVEEPTPIADSMENNLDEVPECEVFEHEAEESVPVVDDQSRSFLSEITKPSANFDEPLWSSSKAISEKSFVSSYNTEVTQSGSKEVVSQPKPNNGWKCPMCDMLFDTSEVLVDHVHSAHSDMKAGDAMSCPFCNKIFPTYTQLDEHITKLHGDGTHSCQGCFSVYQRSSLLRRHQQDCGLYKALQKQVKQAENTDSSTKTEVAPVSTCSFCLIQFSTSDLLSDHVKDCHTDSLTKKYNCEGCKAGYDLLKGLYTHQTECMVFLGLRNTSIKSSYSVQFSCHGCHSVIGNYSEFQKHKQDCSLVKGVLESELLNVSENHAKHESNNNKLDIVDHDESQSLNNQKPTILQRWQCTDCEVHFATADRLDKHKEGCKGSPDAAPVKEYVCPECLTSFEYKCLLEFHMDVHKNGECMPFKCLGCKAGFSTIPYKVNHERSCVRLMQINEELKHDTVTLEPDIVENDSLPLKNNQPEEVVEEPMEVTDSMQCPAISQSSKPFWCKACSEQFAFFCDYEHHLESCMESNQVGTGVRQEPNASSQRVSPRNVLDTDKQSESSSVYNQSNSGTTEGIIECPICGVDISSTQDKKGLGKANKHIAGHDEPSKRYRCVACKWSCDYRNLFTSHSRECKVLSKLYPYREYNSSQVRCPACFVLFTSIGNVKKHFMTHHFPTNRNSDGVFHSCDGCLAIFGQQASKDAHIKKCGLYKRTGPTLNGNKNRCCGVCGLEFVSFNGHHKDCHSFKVLNNLPCIVCNEKFAELDDLIIHVNTNCCLSFSIIAQDGDEKGLPTNSVNSGSEDLQWSDKDSQFSESSSKGDIRSCPICGTLRPKPSHMDIHTKGEGRPYRCSGCMGGFIAQYNLQRHQRSCVVYRNLKNGNVSGTPMPLDDVCEMQVQETNSELLPTQHQTSCHEPNDIELPLNGQTGQLSDACPTCGEVLGSELELAQHILVMHTRARHACAYCFKPFMHKESLREHELYCGQPNVVEFNVDSTQNSLSKKNKDDDEIEEWKCLSCCVKFVNETQFLLHIASHEVTNVNRCHLCPLTFKSAADICMHMVKYHKLYLTTGLKPENQANVASDKELDGDSDVDVETLHLTTQQANAERLNRALSRSAVTNDSFKTVSNQKIVSKAKEGTVRVRQVPSKEKILGTQCMVCNRDFKTNVLLKRHYGIHDGTYSSVCLVCGIGFAKLAAYKLHKSKVHKTPKSADLTCSKCDGVFDQKFKLTNHMDLCICPKKEVVMQCLLCTRTFESWNKLKSHVWTHINKCTYCLEKITVYSKRVDHMALCPKNPLNQGANQQPIGLKSDTTSAASPSTSTLAEKKRYKCEECCATYTSMTSLKKHQLLHIKAEYRCRMCGGKFVSLLAKNKHVLQHHQSTNKKIKAATVKKEPVENKKEPIILKTYFTCDTCNRCFPNKEEKDAHDRAVHSTPVKAFNCKLCDKRFPSKFARRRHMQKSHSGGADTQVQSLACHVCGKRFPSNFAKLQHLKKIHQITDLESIPLANKKQRVCKLCGASFEHKAELKAHKRTEHAQEFKTESSGLSNGMFVTGEAKSEVKIKTCKLCGDTFPNKAELRTHVQTVHHAQMAQAAANLGTIQSNTFSSTSNTVTVNSSHQNGSIIFNLPQNTAGEEKRNKVRACKDCSMTFTSKSDLKAHRKAEHKEVKAEPAVFTFTGDTLQMLDRKPPATEGVVDTNDDNRPLPKTVRVLGAPPPPPPMTAATSAPSTSAPRVAAPTTDTDSKLPFKCDHCPKAFKLRISLNQHHTKAHPWIP